MLAGTVAATIRNVQRTKDTDKLWSWDDFFVRVKQVVKVTSEAALDTKLAIFDALGRMKNKNAKPR